MLSRIKHIDYWVVGLFFVGIFLFLYLTGTLISGYHFIDDHSMISMHNTLATNSFLQTIVLYVKNDFLIRFRPIFFFYYVSLSQVFGLNFFAMAAFVGVLASATFSLFYLGMRKLNKSVLISILFTLLIFIGPQTAIWWRLGTNETIAIFLLGLSFFFLAKCSEAKNYMRNNLLFTATLVLAALSKESFLIVIPAFAFLKVWNEKESHQITFIDSIKKNWLLIFPLLTTLFGMIIIKFFIGTNQIGYAGVTSTFREFLSGIKHIILGQASLLNWVILLSVLIVLYLVSLLPLDRNWRKDIPESFIKLLPYVLFSATLVVPEILMHAKSGMVERYLVPTTFGLAFLVAGLLETNKKKITKYLSVLSILIFIVISFNASILSARAFALDGRDTGNFFSAIKSSVASSESILLVVDPINRYEVSHSIKSYLSYYGYNKLYVYPLMMVPHTTDFELSLEKQWKEWFVGKGIENLNSKPDVIIIFDGVQVTDFFQKSGLVQSEYKVISSPQSGHIVYQKAK